MDADLLSGARPKFGLGVLSLELSTWLPVLLVASLVGADFCDIYSRSGGAGRGGALKFDGWSFVPKCPVPGV